MEITSITVSSGRTFNHPHERYANFRFDLHLAANLSPGEDAESCRLELQQLAEQSAEQHKREILTECRRHEIRRQLTQKLNDLLAEAEATPKRIANRVAEAAELELYQAGGDKPGWFHDYPGMSSADGFRQLESELDRLRQLAASLPAKISEIRSRLAALPEPKLLPAPDLHAGHPDSADTDDESDWP